MDVSVAATLMNLRTGFSPFYVMRCGRAADAARFHEQPHLAGQGYRPMTLE
jgi:hypothetical protein